MVTKNHTYIPIIVTIMLLLFGVGLQSAQAHAFVADSSHSPSIRVDSCHAVIAVTQEQTTPCCKTAICHRDIPNSRDLGIPEYSRVCHDHHLFIPTLRIATPQLRSGEPFILASKAIKQLRHVAQINAIPRQSLCNLRTTVLLN